MNTLIDFLNKGESLFFIGGRKIKATLTLKQVLRFQRMISDNKIYEACYILLASIDLQGAREMTKREVIKEALRIKEELIDKKSTQNIPTDVFGNPIKSLSRGSDKKLFDLDYDSEEIYASFVQAYNIDLIDSANKISWERFVVLLSNLQKNTPFYELIKIRSWQPQKGDSAEYKKQMRDLQRKKALPPELL